MSLKCHNLNSILDVANCRRQWRHYDSSIEFMAFSISEQAYVSSQNSPVGIQAYLTRHMFPVIYAFKSSIAVSNLLAFIL